MVRGRFITLEGGEGVGKSTQVRALADELTAAGIEVVVTREPGGSPGAEAIRALLLSGDEGRWSARAEALLFAAARADHLEKTIQPALDGGKWVLCDRFVDSSIAYQGSAGGLGMDAIRQVHRFACNNLLPDRTLVLESDEGDARVARRDGAARDRIGGRAAGYHSAVALAFRQIARDEPGRVKLVDASGTPEEVTARLMAELADLLP